MSERDGLDHEHKGLTRRDVVLRGGLAGAGALAIPSLLAACGGDDEEPEAAEQTAGEKVDFTIFSVSHGPAGDPFWAVYRKGVEDASKRFGVEVQDVVPERFDVQLVVNNFNSALAAKPDGIIFTPTDPAAFEGPARQAIDQGIPLIAVNVNDPRPPDQRIAYLFYVGGSEELGGRVTAQRQLQERTPKRAACANQAVGHIGLEARCKGYADVMAEAGVQVDKLNITEDPTKASEVLRGYFSDRPEADALFTLGPVGAIPALQVLDEAGLSDKVMHSSFDLTQEQVDAIKDGKLVSTVGQQQYLQGFYGIQMMLFHLQHSFTLAADVLTGPFVIDKSNIEKVEEGVKEKFL